MSLWQNIFILSSGNGTRLFLKGSSTKHKYLYSLVENMYLIICWAVLEDILIKLIYIDQPQAGVIKC